MDCSRAPKMRCVGFPDVAYLGPSEPSAEFTGVIFDCAHPEDVSFEWTVSDGLVAATPEAQTTLVTATDMPSWRRVAMSVSAFFGSCFCTMAFCMTGASMAATC